MWILTDGNIHRYRHTETCTCEYRHTHKWTQTHGWYRHTETHKHSRGHAGAGKVDLPYCPHIGSHFSWNLRLSLPWRGRLFLCSLMAISSKRCWKGRNGTAERVSTMALWARPEEPLSDAPLQRPLRLCSSPTVPHRKSSQPRGYTHSDPGFPSGPCSRHLGPWDVLNPGPGPQIILPRERVDLTTCMHTLACGVDEDSCARAGTAGVSAYTYSTLPPTSPTVWCEGKGREQPGSNCKLCVGAYLSPK